LQVENTNMFDQRELNMRQRRWIEYLKDFDFSLSITQETRML
jgi:hypothetical protein